MHTDRTEQRYEDNAQEAQNDHSRIKYNTEMSRIHPMAQQDGSRNGEIEDNQMKKQHGKPV